MPCIPNARPHATWSKTNRPITCLPSKTTNPRSSTTSPRSLGSVSPLGAETCEKGHGRLEIRRIWTSTALNPYLNFPYAGQVFRIERERTELKTDKTRRETAYGITALTPQQANPERLLHLNRHHWSIENRSHYVRDVTFDEDRSQVRTRNGPRVMATLRNFAISLLRLLGVTSIPSQLRAYARKPHLVLRLLGV